MKALITHRWIPWPLVLMWLAVVVGAMAGCSSDPSELDAAIAAMKETRQQVQAEVEKIKVEVSKSALPPEQRAAWESKLQKASDYLVKVEAVEKKLEERRADLVSGDPGRAVAAGGQAVGEAVGGPYGALIGLGGTLIGSILTGAYKQRQLTALKGSAVEAIGTFSTGIASGLIPLSEDAKARLHQAQTDRAKALVREAQAFYGDAMTLAKPKS